MANHKVIVAQHRRALIVSARDVANDMIHGNISLKAGRAIIHDSLCDKLDHPLYLLPWCCLDAGLDPDSILMKPIEGESLDIATLAQAHRFVGQSVEQIEFRLRYPFLSFSVYKNAIKKGLGHLDHNTSKLESSLRHSFRGPTGIHGTRSQTFINTLRWISRFFLSAAWVLWIGLIIVMLNVLPLHFKSGMLILFPLWATAAFYVFKFGKSMGALTAKEAMLLRPEEKPVLYLRSFTDDRLGGNTNGESKFIYEEHEEEILADVFNPIGPFVAVGNPDEILIEFGASRAFLDHSNWKDEVRSLMTQSKLVVLKVGDTPSFRWELETAMETVKPNRLLLYFPRSMNTAALATRYSNIRQSINTVIPKALPTQIGENRFLMFSLQWDPLVFGDIQSVLKIKLFLPSFITLAIKKQQWTEQLRTALEPFFYANDFIQSQSAMIQDSNIRKASWLGGPFAGGLMMSLNLWVSRRRALAVSTLTLGLLLSILTVFGVKWVYTTFYSDDIVQMIQGYTTSAVIAFAVSSLFYQSYKILRPTSISSHLNLGGRIVHPLATRCLLLCGCVVWIFTALSIWSPNTLKEAFNRITYDNASMPYTLKLSAGGGTMRYLTVDKCIGPLYLTFYL